ncbi:cytochrome P450 [Favolaschia claudopus]|uniref:Cytochrome P450 n=1 Tax=Favolaschia claudopus TaxID=2862362 RepID=A0AAW0DBT6_9AGAR
MAPSSYPSALVFSSLILVFVVLLKRWHTASRQPFPPGPKPKLFIGNLLDIPTERPWLTYTEWGKRYGHITHFEAFGNHVVVLNSLKAATELLEKRTRNYSDRPNLPIMDLMGWGICLSIMRHGGVWRQYRRLFHQYFRRDAIPTYHPIYERKIQGFLRNLLSTPEHFVDHIKTLSAAIIMATMFGYEVNPTNDPFVGLAEEGVRLFAQGLVPGRFAVNTFPILRYFPSWFPGCGFHRFARDASEVIERMKTLPFKFVQQNMQHGVGASSVVREMLESPNSLNCDSVEEMETTIKNVAAVGYAAANETTAATLLVFFLAMALNPPVLRKAQEEIDSVVGPGRIPQMGDRPGLPYCEAMVRELYRFLPTVPLAIPHATLEDDFYEGYFIPKGTTIIPNVWAMTHDESVYTNPDEFRPERFLDKDGQLNSDDRVLGFGFGRRICAGRYAADAVNWLAIVSTLSIFDIEKAKDENGMVIPIEPRLANEVITHPMPFKCAITPRNHETRKVVEGN